MPRCRRLLLSASASFALSACSAFSGLLGGDDSDSPSSSDGGVDGTSRAVEAGSDVGDDAAVETQEAAAAADACVVVEVAASATTWFLTYSNQCGTYHGEDPTLVMSDDQGGEVALARFPLSVATSDALAANPSLVSMTATFETACNGQCTSAPDASTMTAFPATDSWGADRADDCGRGVNDAGWGGGTEFGAVDYGMPVGEALLDIASTQMTVSLDAGATIGSAFRKGTDISLMFTARQAHYVASSALSGATAPRLVVGYCP